MAVNMFLKFQGPPLEGESQVGGHEKEFDIDSWSFGATQTGSAQRGTGAGTAKADVQDVHVSKLCDKGSPILFGKILLGKHFDKATISCNKAGGDNTPVEYLKIEMEEVFIASIQWGGHDGNEMVSENLSLNFGKITFTYTPQGDDGSPDVAVSQKWNIAKNQET